MLLLLYFEGKGKWKGEVAGDRVKTISSNKVNSSILMKEKNLQQRQQCDTEDSMILHVKVVVVCCCLLLLVLVVFGCCCYG